MAAGEYPVGLDEGMGPERTGSGPLGLGRFWTKYVLNIVEFVGTILQVRRDGMDLPWGLFLSCMPQTHVSCRL